MKRFNWKIVSCVVPVLLSAAIVGYAFYAYQQGLGGFKLGVDLAGGTDLIYEVDKDKSPKDFDPQVLAATLKKRIDPIDLFNVTIRPIGDTRVEIILPTGGQHQASAEEKVWDGFLKQVFEKWPIKGYQIRTGHTTELLARVNAQYPVIDGKSPEESIQIVQSFIAANYKPKTAGQPDDAAWKKMLEAVNNKWPPQRYEVGRGRLQELVSRVREQYPEVSEKDANDPQGRTVITKFIDDNYAITKEKRQLTSEEVQHIKELIAQVGKLEFRILANPRDDKDAIEAAGKWFTDVEKNAARKQQLHDLAVIGKPPPPPVSSPTEPSFPVNLEGEPRHTYSWVELGKLERNSMHLNNKAAKDPKWEAHWKELEQRRKEYKTYQDGDMLVYSRAVEDPREEPSKGVEYFVLTRDPLPGQAITGDYLETAFPSQNQQNLQLEVAFRFRPEGGRLFYDLTSTNKPSGSDESAFRRRLAVILDDKIESAPTLNAVISTDGRIEGRFTKDDVDRLVRVFRSGALQASLKPLPASESTMGPTLGLATIRAGTWSVVIAFAAILIFMLIYYEFAGVVACIALLANLLLTVAFMVLVNATFTLPGLAGLVLMIGMAVDANVLIYERLREERDRGASLALAIRNGYDRAFPTIIDTHLSSIFTAIVLYAVGNDQLKGFGISLTVGLIISLFTSLYMTRLIFDIWLYKGWVTKLNMRRLFSRPNIDFMGIRYYWFTATILLTLFGATVFFYRGVDGLNIDFTGGTAYGGKLKKMVNAETLRSDMEGKDLPADQRDKALAMLPDLTIEQLFVSSNDPNEKSKLSEGSLSKLFNVRTSNRDPQQVQSAISMILGDKLQRTELEKFEIGSQPREKEAVLSFTEIDPDSNQKKPAFASRSQVSMILAREFNRAGLRAEAEQFLLEGLGKEEEGRFQWMTVQLLQPIAKDKLDTVLKATQQEFRDRPQPERLDNFDSQLARDTQARALYAILASWGAILLYLWFRFGNWTFGLAAVLCLIHDLFFTLGIIAFCHWIHTIPGIGQPISVFGFFNINMQVQEFKLDLPAVAALLTLVGYSVNDTIVVFDRIREVRGKNPLLTPQMINDSVNQTLSRTLLTSFATWLVVIVLYIFGGEGVHLFAFVMVVGVVVGTYSSIYIASPLLLIFGEGTPKKTYRDQPAAVPAGSVTG